MNNLTRRYGSILGPLVVIIIILGLYMAAGQLLFGRIQAFRNSHQIAESERQALTNRLTTLQEAERVVLSSTSVKLIEALPEKNPSLFVVAQLRDEASRQQVILDNLNLSTHDSQDNTLSYVGVEFDVRGTYEQVSSFVSSLEKAMPLMKLATLRLNETTGQIEASLTLQSYWSPFPQTLPTITEPINGLSDSEIETLNTISEFKELTISEVIPAVEEVTPREDPFFLEL